MAFEKIRLGTNEDGSPLFHYSNPDGAVVVTGSATGSVTLPDGSVVDVTDAVIPADSVEHAEAIVAAIDAAVAPADETPSKKKG